VVPDKAPIGVVSFAGTEHRLSGDGRFYALADALVGERTSESEDAFCNDLQSALNAQFWTAINQSDELPTPSRQTAHNLVVTLLGAQSTSDGATREAL
jgi:hypothetical protein